jgi:hypothetical protein
MRTKSSALISRENNTAQEQNTEQIDAVGAETAASAVEAGLRIHGTAHQIGLLLLLLRFNLPIARNTTSSFPPRRPGAASCAGPQIEQGRGRRACRRHQQLAPCGVPCLHLARAQAARAPPPPPPAAAAPSWSAARTWSSAPRRDTDCCGVSPMPSSTQAGEFELRQGRFRTRRGLGADGCWVG